MEVKETPVKAISVNEKFFRRFQHDETALQQQMRHLKDSSVQQSERATLIEQCLAAISGLSDQVRDASPYLPTYDQRTYSAAIKTLRDKLQDTCATSAPKRKFAFKKAMPQQDSIGQASGWAEAASAQALPPAESAITPSQSLGSTKPQGLSQDGLKAAAVPTINQQPPGSNTSTALTVNSLSREHYIPLQSSLQNGPSASITNVHHSLIDLSASATLAQALATMTIKSITESLLLCGRVNGAVHITSVEKSTLAINSRQLRMHECNDCVVYLRCSSRPIIEDCKDIRFAPLPSVWDDGDPHSNLWDHVDDFKWLRAEHSPNWRILNPRDERAVGSEAWDVVMVGFKSQLGLDDLLKTTNIIK